VSRYLAILRFHILLCWFDDEVEAREFSVVDRAFVFTAAVSPDVKSQKVKPWFLSFDFL
jgi:hypothetical protein